jgi:hypothetical protein
LKRTLKGRLVSLNHLFSTQSLKSPENPKNRL